MKEYYPHNVKQTTTVKQMIKYLVGADLLLISFVAHSVLGMVASVLFLFGTLLKKWVIIDDTGLHVYYNAYFFKYEEMWTFEEMTTIHKDDRHCGAGEYMLHFGRDVMSRRYVFSKTDAEEIINLAQGKNPDIEIGLA